MVEDRRAFFHQPPATNHQSPSTRLGLGGSLLLAAAGLLAGLARLGLALAQAGGLADPVAEVVELGAADLAGALDLDLGDLGRVKREDALDPLALDDAADGEHLAHPLALAGDHDALEDLHALLL